MTDRRRWEAEEKLAIITDLDISSMESILDTEYPTLSTVFITVLWIS